MHHDLLLFMTGKSPLNSLSGFISVAWDLLSCVQIKMFIGLLRVEHLFVSSCFKLEKFDKPAKLKWVKASAFLHDSFVNRGFKTVYNVITAIAEDLVYKRKQKGIKMLNTWAESKLPLRAK